MSNNVEATGPNSSGKTPFKNKSERNKGYKSEAQILFEGKKLLLERPPEMSREDYRLLRKFESEAIKQLFHKGHSPSRKLQGIMGSKEPLARTKKGIVRVTKRMIKQRKAS